METVQSRTAEAESRSAKDRTHVAFWLAHVLFRWTVALAAAAANPFLTYAGEMPQCNEAALVAHATNGGVATFTCDGTILLTKPIIIERDTEFDGANRKVIISGGSAVRLFEVRPGATLTLKSLTLRDGYHAGTAATEQNAAGNGYGGGIAADNSNLVLMSCVFTSCVVSGGAGFVENASNGGSGKTVGGKGYGSAIYISGGSLYVTNCFFETNGAHGGLGGAPWAGGLNYVGRGGDALGGAIYCSNTLLTLAETNFRQGSAQAGKKFGGTARANSGGGLGFGGFVGGIEFLSAERQRSLSHHHG